MALESIKTITTIVSILMGLLASGRHVLASEDKQVIRGTVDIGLIQKLAYRERIDLPAILFFDAAGCLVWQSFGLKDGLGRELREAIASSVNCDTTRRDAAESMLRHEGIPIPEGTAGPLLVWYSSDLICQRCADLRTREWHSLTNEMPDTTLMVDLDWKR